MRSCAKTRLARDRRRLSTSRDHVPTPRPFFGSGSIASPAETQVSIRRTKSTGTRYRILTAA